MEINQIQDLNDGDVNNWFQEIISQAELFISDQEETLANLQKNKSNKSKSKINISYSNKNISPPKPPSSPDKAKKQQLKPQNNSNLPKSNVLNFKDLYSLKALDQYMIQYDKSPAAFCLCFQRKLAIFEEMKKNLISPQRYKQLIQKTSSTTTNQKLKNIIQMQELFDIDEMYAGDLNKWFENLINETGQNYEDQQKKYNAIKGIKNDQAQNKRNSQSIIIDVRKSSLNHDKKRQEVHQIKSFQKPLINEIYCITALIKLFVSAVQQTDYLYYKQLCMKRDRMLQLIMEQKLKQDKYKEINTTTFGKTTNVFLKNQIKLQLKRIQLQFQNKVDKWFAYLVQLLKKPPPQLKSIESPQKKRINSLPSQKKIDFFLRKMSTYESLYYYYKKNKIPINQNKELVIYQKQIRKQTAHYIDIILKDQTFDVFSVCAKLFPPIDPQTFYAGNLNAFKSLVKDYINKFQREKAQLKDYLAKLKKAGNADNFETTKKQIVSVQQNIAYLKSWSQSLMTPAPIFKQQKIEKYNMDINKKLNKNEIQIIITQIEGLGGSLVMKVYICNFQQEKYSCTVQDGNANIAFTSTLQQKQMYNVIKGGKFILIRLFSKRFFGGLTLIHENYIQTLFIRSNTVEERLVLNNVTLYYILKIQKPLRPTITQIIHCQLTKFPPYKHDKFVQEQLIKKYVMYSSPTASQIITV